jgi:hypothetical protein
MIFLVTGTDRRRAVDYFNRCLVDATGELFNFQPDNFDPDNFREKLLGKNLFTGSHTVAARDLSELAVARTAVQELGDVLAATPHRVWFLETGEGNDLATWLQERADEIKTFILPPTQKVKFNPFSLADALGARDRQRLWLLFQEALADGLEPDEIFWKLFWQAKNMLLVAVSRPGEETGLKPFVAGKARRAAQNYTSVELQALFGQLVDLYHSHYPNSDEFNFSLEKLILTI